MSVASSAPNASAHRTRFLADVLGGLRATPRSLPFQYFYDARGAELFVRICDQPEYYPATVETAIMDRHAAEMGKTVGPRAAVVEYGSGAGIKTRLLLDGLVAPACYVPIDISGEQLAATARDLSRDYPAIPILPVQQDFTRPVPLPTRARMASRVVAFAPGCTFWNLPLDDRDAVLTRISEMVGRGGGLLIGVDLVKDPAILEAAYDDAAGVTAAFNLNLLSRINRELGADFDPAAWRHHARWDADHGRMEIGAVSLADQRVHVGDEAFVFRAGELVTTEHSYKFTADGFATAMARYGFERQARWTDDADLFAVEYLTVP